LVPTLSTGLDTIVTLSTPRKPTPEESKQLQETPQAVLHTPHLLTPIVRQQQQQRVHTACEDSTVPLLVVVRFVEAQGGTRGVIDPRAAVGLAAVAVGTRAGRVLTEGARDGDVEGVLHLELALTWCRQASTTGARKCSVRRSVEVRSWRTKIREGGEGGVPLTNTSKAARHKARRCMARGDTRAIVYVRLLSS
jgi:hypothetical protein